MNNFVEIVVPGLIAVLCIARQFIAGVTGSPSPGFQLQLSEGII